MELLKILICKAKGIEEYGQDSNNIFDRWRSERDSV